MQKFLVRYYFGENFYTSRVIESENKKDAYSEAMSESTIQFEEKEVLYSFKKDDIKYVSVSKHAPAGVSRGIRR